MSNCNIKRLQRVQHFAARTVANAHSRSSVSCIMKDLHWLPISQRIDYKVALTTFKLLAADKPEYLRCLLKVPLVDRTGRILRSSNAKFLDIPFCKTVLSSRAFSAYAPRLWNSFPQSLREYVNLDHCSSTVSVEAFKRKLKTELFCNVYNVTTG